MLNDCRNDFPTLQGDNPPAYLDNACVTLKPQSVINSIHRYYTETSIWKNWNPLMANIPSKPLTFALPPSHNSVDIEPRHKATIPKTAVR